MDAFRSNMALRLTATYLVFGLTWILVTDYLVASFADAQGGIATLQTYKGSIFVVLSALLMFVMMRREIFARLQARQQLRLIESGIENIHEGVIISSPLDGSDGPVVEYANPAMTHITGYTRAEMIGSSSLPQSGESADQQGTDAYREQIRNGQPASAQAVTNRKDGSSYVAEWQTVPIPDEHGNILHFVTTHRDVTRRHRAESRLRESEQRFRSLYDLNPDAVYALDLEGRITMLNDAATKVMEHPVEEIIGRRFADFSPAPETEDVTSQFQRVLQGESLHYDSHYFDRSGQRVDIEGMALPILIDGEVTGVFGVMKDVTRRNHSERQLHTQVRRLDALHAIDRAITSGSDLQTVLSEALYQIVNLLEVDAATIAVYDSDEQVLRYQAMHGFAPPAGASLTVDVSDATSSAARAMKTMRNVSDITTGLADVINPALVAGVSFGRYISVPLIAKDRSQGVVEVFFSSDSAPDPEWFDMLSSLVTQTTIAIDNAALLHGLQQSNLELSAAYDTTLEGWARALEMRDDETSGHSQRVTDLSLRLAREMGVAEEDLVDIRRGALLHDIGKMAIPDRILSKPGPLSSDEWVIMRQHPEYGRQMLEHIPFLRDALTIPYCHHERWDGSGYPRGLAGESIPLAARIFAVVDVWDALLSDRPYRLAWNEADVREHIRNGIGSHFDPRIAEAFLAVMPEPSRT